MKNVPTTFTREFQTHIVACMIKMPLFTSRFFDLLKPDYFTDRELADVVDYVCAFYTQYACIPSKESLTELTDNPKLVKQLYSQNIDDIIYVEDTVADFCKIQAVKDAVLQCAKNINNGNLSDLVSPLTKALSVGEKRDIGEFFTGDMEDRILDYLYPDQVRRVPTGMAELDQCMGGGLGAGELGVFMGASKVGKSYVLANIGANNILARTHPIDVVHYSLEMNQRKILRRYDTRIARVEAHIIRENPEAFVEKLRKRSLRLIQGRVVVKSYPTRSAGYSTFKAHLAQLNAVGIFPGLIIIDYGDIMKAERRKGDMRHEQASCFEDIRELAGENNSPAWSGTQCNRAAVSKPTLYMEDIAESYEKVQICDAFVPICQTIKEKRMNEARFHLAGLREEKSGVIIKAHWDLSRAFIDTYEIVKGSSVVDKAASDARQKQNAALSNAEKRGVDYDRKR